MSRRIQIAIINEADRFPDEGLDGLVAALQHQIDHDFRSTWGIAAELHAVHKGKANPAEMWWLALLNDSDQAGALGYHDLTPDTLHPVAKVFVNEDLKYDAEVSVTTSHELLEMLGDPYINTTALDPVTGRLYAYETSDAVEADELGYEINDVLVSDFVLPKYFDPQHAGRGQALSFKGHVSEPFSLAKGGYANFLDLSNLDAGWQQMMADADPNERQLGQRPPGFPPGSRRERRRRRFADELAISNPQLVRSGE